MFSNGKDETVIAAGLRIEGNVTADGLVTVHGCIVGDIRCAALNISDKANITGAVIADSIVINGTVEGPIRGADVILKPRAHVVGDIHHTSLSIEKGARFDGRSQQSDADGDEGKPQKAAASE
jgi:cytoskeletal protein CcmA (bactofilin family)